MKFDDLLKTVFIGEADIPPVSPAPDATTSPDTINLPDENEELAPAADGDPTPDKYSVEPAPVVAPPAVDGGGSADTLKNYVTKFADFIEELNGLSGDSLQKLVNDLDIPGTVFDGISDKASADITKVAKALAELNQTLQGFLLSSVKKARDLNVNAR
jgi:hypothetical protein